MLRHLLIPGLLLFAARPALAQSSYSEDFSTSAYEDTLTTTAEWDTLNMHLAMPAFEPTIVGLGAPAGIMYESRIVGDLLYAAGTGGLEVFDVTDPTNPVLLGSVALAGGPSGLAVDGPLAYVAARSGGLFVVDCTNPASPLQVGALATGGMVQDVAVAGNLLYLANDGLGLQIVDVEDPTTPVLVGSLATGGNAQDVAVHGGIAYLADYSEGLQIIDVSDPTIPTLLNNYNPGNIVVDVWVDFPIAYIANWLQDLTIIDVSDPLNPVHLSQTPTDGIVNGVEAHGDRLHVSDRGAGVKVFDVSDPSAPVLVGGVNPVNDAESATADGEFAAVPSRGTGTHLVRTSHASRLVERGSYYAPGTSADVDVQGGRAYLAHSDALRILDISSPGSISELGSWTGLAYGVELDGRYACVSSYGDGINILDIADPALPVLVGNYNTPGFATSSTLDGDVLYVADFSSVQILDVSDRTNPALLGAYTPAGTPRDIDVSGIRAYIAMGNDQLEVVDIRIPGSPVLLATPDVGGANAVVLRGNIAYVARTAPAGLGIFDMTNPSAPTLIGSYLTNSGFTTTLEVSGDRVYLGQSTGVVFGIDISDPTNPVYATSFAGGDAPGAALDGDGFAVAGQNLYVAEAASGVRVLQVMEDEVDLDGRFGQSLSIDDSDELVRKFRLTRVATQGVGMQVSADGGTNWQGAVSGAGWSSVLVPGSDLVWRGILEWVGFNPILESVDIEWLYDHAPILSVEDVPDDQGGQVRLNLRRSALDFANEPSTPVVGYQVYQRVAPAMATAVLNSTEPAMARGLASPMESSFGPAVVRTMGARTFVIGDDVGAGAGTFPAGVWEAVNWVAATQTDDYLVRCTTVSDSTDQGSAWSEYLVTTHTTVPSVWFASPSVSGYSVDNIAPGVPQNLLASYAADQVSLDWDDAPEDDFRNYRVYRGSSPDFEPTPASLVEETAVSMFDDSGPTPWGRHFKITTVDQAGNESEAASPQTMTGVEGEPVHRRTVLYGANPNPFNPRTTIAFSLPAAGPVRLAVYDVAGRLVSTLINDTQPEGRHEVQWDGLDSGGRQVGSGVYLYRLEAAGFVEARRMVLIK